MPTLPILFPHAYMRKRVRCREMGVSDAYFSMESTALSLQTFLWKGASQFAWQLAICLLRTVFFCFCRHQPNSLLAATKKRLATANGNDHVVNNGKTCSNSKEKEQKGQVQHHARRTIKLTSSKLFDLAHEYQKPTVVVIVQTNTTSINKQHLQVRKHLYRQDIRKLQVDAEANTTRVFTVRKPMEVGAVAMRQLSSTDEEENVLTKLLAYLLCGCQTAADYIVRRTIFWRG